MYKLQKYKGKHKIKDTKTGKTVEIDIEKYMNGGEATPSYSLGGEDCNGDPECIERQRMFEGAGEIDYSAITQPQSNGIIDEKSLQSISSEAEDYEIESETEDLNSWMNSRPFKKDMRQAKRYEAKNNKALYDEIHGTINESEKELGIHKNNSQVPPQEGNYNLPNPYAGVDIPGAAQHLGQSIKNKSALGIAASSLKLAVGLGRNVVSGLGRQNRYNQVMKDYYQKQKNNKNPVQYLAYGGKRDEELATGEYMSGIENEDIHEFNAEVEKGEYFQTNEGDISEVVGKKHSQGGEKIKMEAEDRVLSDKLKLGAKTAKVLSEKYDLKLKAKNTYSDVLDKFRRKSKLDKLVDEESDILKKIEDQSGVTDTITRGFNLQVLSEKKKDIEKQKHPIEEQRKEMFEELFNIQEDSKPKEKNKDNSFENGGKLEALAKEYNIPLERAKQLVQEFSKGGKLAPKYNDGGPGDDKDKKKKKKKEAFKFLVNEFLDDSELGQEDTQTETTTGQEQGARVGNFGFQTKEEQVRLEQLKRNFPVEFAKTFKKNDKGVFEIIPDEKGKIQGRVLDFQNRVDSNYQYLLDEVGPTLGEEDRKAFEEQIAQRRFQKDGKHARRFDDNLGLFTSTRTNVELPFSNPEDLKKLQDLGITTKGELFKPDGTLRDEVQGLDLGQDTLSTIDRVKDYKSNFLLGEYTPEEEEAVEDAVVDPVEDITISDDVRDEDYNGGLAGMYLFPDETPLPPSALQGTIKPEARFDRVRPSEIDAEPYLQDIRDREQSQVQSLEGLSPNVRAAVLANMRSNSQKSESQVRNQIDTQNIQSQEKAIYTNAQIQAKEQLQNNNYRQGYEQRQYRAQALTDADENNYFNQLQAINKQRFMDIHNMNLVNATNEDVYFDGQNYRRKHSDDELFDRATRKYRQQ